MNCRKSLNNRALCYDVGVASPSKVWCSFLFFFSVSESWGFFLECFSPLFSMKDFGLLAVLTVCEGHFVGKKFIAYPIIVYIVYQIL